MGQIEVFNLLIRIIVISYLKLYSCLQIIFALSAGAVEYTDCTSAEG